MSNDDATESTSPSGASPDDTTASEPVTRDQRRFPRLAKECRIRVRALSGMEKAAAGIEAMTVNISGGGLCYHSDTPVAPGEFVAVELQMSELESPVLALARAAYCAPEGPPHEVGLEFWWVGWGDDSAQRAISDLIKTELRQQGDA